MKSLRVILTRTAENKPLTVIRNFPGLDAEMTPDRMRELAAALIEAADDCERYHADRFSTFFRDTDREYLFSTSEAEKR